MKNVGDITSMQTLKTEVNRESTQEESREEVSSFVMNSKNN